MRSEIGSEFWNVPIDENQNFFDKKMKWFLSGRIALRYIIEEIARLYHVKNVAMPSWCCESMVIPFVDAGLEVEFYPVYCKGGELVQEVETTADILFVMDYFGFSSDADYSNYDGIVIRDLTHSVFSKYTQDADYYFGSVRKWCGVWTGGFAFAKNDFRENIVIKECHGTEYPELRKNAMLLKSDYIAESSDSKEYLQVFGEAEQILDYIKEIISASVEDVVKLSNIDAEYIQERRRRNVKVLLDELRDIALFQEIKETDCPLFFPILVKDRDALKKHLISKEIYCPAHWPISEYHKLTEKTKQIYGQELSIICDQRYSAEDMKRICSEIKKGLMK